MKCRQAISVKRLGLCVMFILIAACSGSYGHLVRSNAVGNLFERHEVLPDHRYFLTGPQSRPNAILAVHRSYTLQPGLWRPVEMTPRIVKRAGGCHDRPTGIYPYHHGCQRHQPGRKTDRGMVFSLQPNRHSVRAGQRGRGQPAFQRFRSLDSGAWQTARATLLKFTQLPSSTRPV